MIKTFITYFLLCCHFANCEKGCEIDVNKNIPENHSPLYLKKQNGKLDFVYPDKKGIFSISVDEDLFISCSTSDNSILNSENNKIIANKSSIFIKCVGLNTFQYGNSKYSIDKYVCKNSLKSIILKTNNTCSNSGGVWYNVSYPITKYNTKDFDIINLEIFQVCINEKSNRVLYSHHTIFGKSISGSEKESKRPSFKISDPISKQCNPDNFYKVQSKKINPLFKLSRGHLSPDADFIYGSQQFSTYYYINTAPQYQIINAGNWLTVEKLSRQFANLKTYDIEILTGIFTENKTETTTTTNNTCVFEIPEFFWKIIYDPIAKKSISFVTSNNFTRTSTDISFCRNECDLYKWKSNKFNNITRGLTKCCSSAELNEKITYLPKDFITDKVLLYEDNQK